MSSCESFSPLLGSWFCYLNPSVGSHWHFLQDFSFSYFRENPKISHPSTLFLQSFYHQASLNSQIFDLTVITEFYYWYSLKRNMVTYEIFEGLIWWLKLFGKLIWWHFFYHHSYLRGVGFGKINYMGRLLKWSDQL